MAWNLKSVFATLPYTERATAMVLNGDPKGKNMLYCNGKTVIIRDIANPAIADTYTQHSVQATVAKYAPSGYYIASGDVSGKIRIWDTVNKEHILKYEYQPFAGVIKDLDWSPDSKRICVCGKGREKFATCFLWDSGSTVGSCDGHEKSVNSITYRPTRPFRIASAGEDFLCCYYEGPPFKFKGLMKEHTRFVNSIRFSPDGNYICSGGSDGLAVIYDGKTSELIGKLGESGKAHDGGIYAVSWSPDSHHILTASGDKSCKIWDVSTRQVVSHFKMGTQIEDQQVGCLWQDDWILSVSLSGNINYLDRNNPDTPLRILTGHSKNIKNVTTTCDGTSLYSASMDGRICYWSTDTGEVNLVRGAGHTNMVCSMAATPEAIYTLGLDKTMKIIQNNEFTNDVFGIPDRDPTAVASNGSLQCITTLNEIMLVREGKKMSTVPLNNEALCVDFHPTKPLVAVGFKNSKVIVYSVEGDELSTVKEIDVQNDAEVNTIAYNPSGDRLAIAGSSRTVFLYDTDTYKFLSNLYSQHTSRINTLCWSNDGKYIATGGVDSNVCIHDMETSKIHLIKGAHPLDVVTGVSWINNTTVASCGNDCTIRVWELSV